MSMPDRFGVVGKEKIPGNPQWVPRDMKGFFHPLCQNGSGTVWAIGGTATPQAKTKLKTRPMSKAGRSSV